MKSNQTYITLRERKSSVLEVCVWGEKSVHNSAHHFGEQTPALLLPQMQTQMVAAQETRKHIA